MTPLTISEFNLLFIFQSIILSMEPWCRNLFFHVFIFLFSIFSCWCSVSLPLASPMPGLSGCLLHGSLLCTFLALWQYFPQALLAAPHTTNSHAAHRRMRGGGKEEEEDYRGGWAGQRCRMGQGLGRDIGQERKKVGKGLMETEEQTLKPWWYAGGRKRMQRVWAGKRVKRWVGCEGAGNYGRFQCGCLANTICIAPMRMKFCDTVICIHLHKINPPRNICSDCFWCRK